MCKRKKRQACGCQCYPKKGTDYLDMFAEDVYKFTFRDSYVVSTYCGSICTIIMILILIVTLAPKIDFYLKGDPSTFLVTTGIEYGYHDASEDFTGYKFAIGVQYKEEYESDMQYQFAKEHLDKLVKIQMRMQKREGGTTTQEDYLKLDPCSTSDFNDFNTPRKSSVSEFNYLKEW